MAESGRVDVELTEQGGIRLVIGGEEGAHVALLSLREAYEIGVGLIGAAAVANVLGARAR